MEASIKKELIRTQVRGVYALQKLRIQMGNRLVGNIKTRDMGIEPSVKEDEKTDEEDKKFLKILRTDYKKIMDGLKTLPTPKKFVATGLISDYAFLALFDQYIQMEVTEDRQFRLLEHVLSTFPIYSTWLAKVMGIGPALGGVIVSEIDIHRAKYPSSLWKYAGLDVVRQPEGQMVGRSRKTESLVKVTYIDAEGEEAERNSITFNPFLKTKLIGVMGSSFLRVGPEKSSYARIYYEYKHRLENRPDLSEHSKGHIHNMSTRYMIKIFLRDLYVIWKGIEGLPIASEYSEGKLGIPPHRKIN